MKIAIKGNSLDKDIRNKIQDSILAAEPYSFALLEISDEYSDCVLSDFDYINGTYSFNFGKYNNRKERMLLHEIRNQRTIECFQVINRGQLWYETLSAQQKYELQTWYQAWLNVTATRIVPQKPNWLS